MAGKWLHREKMVVLADQAVVSGVALLTQLLIVKGAGLTCYGYFSAIMLVQLFVLSIFQAGLSGMYMTVYPTLRPAERKKYTAGVLAWMVPVTLVISVAGLAAFPLHGGMLGKGGFAVVVTGILLALLQDLFRKIFLASGDQHAALVTDVLNSGVQLAGMILLFFLKRATLLPFLTVYTFSFVPALLYAVIRLNIPPSLRNMRLVYHQHGVQAVWLVSSSLLQWFAGNIYIVAAGWWLGATALGTLRLGQYVFGILNVLLQAIENYLLPKVATLTASPALAINYLKIIQRKMLLLAGGGLLLLAFVAGPVLQHIHLSNGPDVLTVIYGMSAVYIFVVAGYPVRIALRTLRHSEVFFKGYVINAAFGICSAYLFIHYWGVAGVVAGLFFSQILLLAYWGGVLQQKYRAVWK